MLKIDGVFQYLAISSEVLVNIHVGKRVRLGCLEYQSCQLESLPHTIIDYRSTPTPEALSPLIKMLYCVSFKCWELLLPSVRDSEYVCHF